MNKSPAAHTLSNKRFDAAVFDLDGVITQTARVHAAAWKEMFDAFLQQRASVQQASAGEDLAPFDIDSDYRDYVDGKPRYDGVRSFLESRGIDLPPGEPEDATDADTVCGLGNRKNERFREKIRRDGVEVYDSSIRLLRALRDHGMRTAVVSSSRNCKAIVQAAGISELFDARVDGVELRELELAGKPAPDMFIEACRRLDSEPQRSIGLEDASAGVQALQAAGYGCVIGVNRSEQAQALYAHGADIVISDAAELDVSGSDAGEAAASALDHLDEIVDADGREPALFLDYDGTLSPIVSHPDEAVVSAAMRSTLQRVADCRPVAIISGRDREDVRARVGLEDIWYAGSHGFDIGGPDGRHFEHPEGREHLPALDQAEQSLRDALAPVDGCMVERKRFSIAVHFRRVAQERVASVREAVEQNRAQHPGLRLSSGKKIFELQPDIDWNKGKALRWLMQTLELDEARVRPVYIGDDVTDEDAFRELSADGVGILVGDTARDTAARYRLDNPDAVQKLLEHVAEHAEQ